MGKNKKDKKKQVQQKRQERKKQRQLLKKMRKKMNKGDNFKLTRQYVTYYQKFDKQLEFLRVKLKDTRGDGNCLFRSMADQLDGTEDTHLFLREQACKYILQNQEFFQNFIDEDEDGTIHQYVQTMRKDGQWGGHLELQALSQCLKCTIVVHKLNHQQYYVTPIISQSSGTVFHLAYFQHQDFEHYLSVRDFQDNSEDPAVNKLKYLNNNMYKHLTAIEDPEELALMKQIEELELNSYQQHTEYNGYNEYQGQNEWNYQIQKKQIKNKKEIKQPYPGLAANKKCKCGSGQIYKNCCLKQYHRKKAMEGEY